MKWHACKYSGDYYYLGLLQYSDSVLDLSDFFKPYNLLHFLLNVFHIQSRELKLLFISL